MERLPTPITHPETAWLALSVPAWLLVAGVLCATAILRRSMLAALGALLRRRAPPSEHSDPALDWAPPIAGPGQLLAVALAAALLTGAAAALAAPLFVAALLAAPAAALAVWTQLRALEARYVAALDRSLPAAVGRLGGYLHSGGGFHAALARVVADLPAGPLRAEWSFFADRLDMPVARGGPAAPAQVAAALSRRTPSARHAAFLDHLEVALDQAHDVLTARVAAASAALYAADRRRSAAATELAQMRYSGVAIGIAGIVMFAYLAVTQHERLARAYQGPLGLGAGAIVALALAAPFAAGMLLARVEDVEY